jgi:hypothetical protein
VDGVTYEEYEANAGRNIRQLHQRLTDGTMDQYGNASALAKRKANRPIVQRLLRRSANQQVPVQ